MIDSLKVLLVEDDPDDQYLIKRVLENGHYEIESVFNGDDCISALAVTDYDIILLDYSLPRDNGLNVLDQIIDEGVDTPVIMITGQGDEKIAAESIKLGAYDYVVKSELARLGISIQSSMELFRERQRSRRSEQALYESEAKYRRLVEASPDITYIYDSVTGDCFRSGQVADILGFTTEDLESEPSLWRDSIHKEDQVHVEAVLNAAMEGNKTEAEYRIRDRHGRWHWLYDRVFNVKSHDSGVIIEGLISDITHRKEVESALRASEEKLSMFFKNMSEGVCLHEMIYDKDGNSVDYSIINYNPSFDKMTGISAAGGPGISASKLYGLDTPPHMDKIIQVAASGRPQVFESYFAATDRYFLISAFSLSETSFGTVIMDITERKKNAEEQEKLLMLIENSSDFIGISTLKGDVTFLNKAGLDLVGLEGIEDVRSTNLSDYVADESKSHLHDHVIPALYKTGVWNGLGVLRHFKTGASINVDIHTFLIHSKETHEPVAIATVMRDISEKIIFSQTLEDIVSGVLGETGESFFRSVVLYLTKHLNVHFAIIGELFNENKSVRTKAVAYRDSIVENFEYDLEGTPCHDVVTQSFCRHSSGVASKYPRALLLVGMGIESYVGLPLADNNHKPLGLLSVMNKRPIENTELHESIIKMLSVRVTAEIQRLREEQERKKLEEQLFHSQKMEAIGTLAGGIAHDFNNILSAINGYTELALNSTESSSQLYSDLQEILKAGKRARDLVGQILMISRVKQEEARPVNIGLIAKEVCKFLRASLPSTIEMKISAGSELMYVMADPVQIHQIIMNICTNGALAMKDTGGKLNIFLENSYLENQTEDVRSFLKAGPHVHLAVSDTGCGIPEEIIERIFDPYFTTREAGEGTGLGLAIVHGIVDGYNGAVTVESEEDVGTVFHVYLPAVEHNDAEAVDARLALPGGNETIIFIDDEEALVSVHCRLFESLGYTVKGFIEPEAALEYCTENHSSVDLVITDMTMPKMTGLDIIENIKKLNDRIPVILCTGYSNNLSPETLVNLKIASLLTKPVSSVEIATTVRTVLDGVASL